MWDENWDVVQLFWTYNDQWRMGFNGPVSLDMVVFQNALERKKLSDEEYDEWIDKLRVIQQEALHRIRYYS